MAVVEDTEVAIFVLQGMLVCLVHNMMVHEATANGKSNLTTCSAEAVAVELPLRMP